MNASGLVERPFYLERLKEWEGTGMVRVLQGVRRCGKSSILATYADDLVSRRGIPEENVVVYDQGAWAAPETADAAYLKEKLSSALDAASPDFPRYVLLDEVQEVEGWEKVVRPLQTLPGTEVCVTGSNAFLLSGELSTLLSGRYVRIEVWPLSFGEYLDFRSALDGRAGTPTEEYPGYQLLGGMPVLFSLRDRAGAPAHNMLSSVFDTVIMNDVALRTQVRDYPLLDRLCRYLFRTSGSLFSLTNVRNYLRSAGMRVHVATLDTYIGALEDALVLHGIAQQGVAGKEVLSPLRKFYPVDTGLRNLADGFANRDTGFQLENVVFVELKRRGWDVSVGKTPKGEVDFFCRKGADTQYIQVSEDLSSAATLERELAPLEALPDSFPKTLLTLDRLHTGVTEDGIQVTDARDWLLGAS